jgi:hypothetical protein
MVSLNDTSIPLSDYDSIAAQTVRRLPRNVILDNLDASRLLVCFGVGLSSIQFIASLPARSGILPVVSHEYLLDRYEISLIRRAPKFP